MIRQPSEMVNVEKKIRILIAGFPGIGKSTLALSAPNPLWVDVDRGFDRVEAQYRKAVTQPQTYEELLEDLKPNNLKDFETIVIDTGGQMIKFMTPYVIRKNSKNGQYDGSLSLKGYGAVGREFERLSNYCAYELNKNLVIVFHAKEEKDGDVTRLRLLVEGQTKDNVWQPMDLGGFIEMQNGKRVIGFTNCDKYYAKGTHGIKGIYNIPELNGGKNTFLTDLFAEVNENIKKETEIAEEQKALYDGIMNQGTDFVNTVENAETANKALKFLNSQENILTSKKELKSMLYEKTKSLNIKWDSKKGAFIDAVSSDTVAS